jgi:hypothetical protein
MALVRRKKAIDFSLSSNNGLRNEKSEHVLPRGALRRLRCMNGNSCASTYVMLREWEEKTFVKSAFEQSHRIATKDFRLFSHENTLFVGQTLNLKDIFDTLLLTELVFVLRNFFADACRLWIVTRTFFRVSGTFMNMDRAMCMIQFMSVALYIVEDLTNIFDRSQTRISSSRGMEIDRHASPIDFLSMQHWGIVRGWGYDIMLAFCFGNRCRHRQKQEIRKQKRGKRKIISSREKSDWFAVFDLIIKWTS